MITFFVFLVIGILVWTLCSSASGADERLQKALAEEREKEARNV